MGEGLENFMHSSFSYAFAMAAGVDPIKVANCGAGGEDVVMYRSSCVSLSAFLLSKMTFG